MVKIIFRTGSSITKEKMLEDSHKTNGVCFYCPENEKDQNEQINFVNYIVDEFLRKKVNVEVISFSDIVFDTFRVAVRDQRLTPQNFEVYFYYDKDKTYSPQITNSGMCKVWPNGFFTGRDEICLDLIREVDELIQRREQFNHDKS